MAMSAAEHQEANIERYASLIDNPGRAHIQKVLRTHNNPAQALIELQETLGLGYSSTLALPLLDLLEVPRASVYQSLFECAKLKLEELLQTLSEEMLLKVLSATFRFITVKDLKSTPLSVIRRLRHIPEKYLKAMAGKKLQGILEEIPLSVRRQVWRVDCSHFIQTVMEHSLQWIKSAKEDGNLRPDHSVESICDLIGDSKYLFSKFAHLCVEKVCSEEKEVLWATLLRHTVMGIMKEKIPALAKLRDFSLQIDQAIRESSIGNVIARNLVNYLKDIRRAAEVTQHGLGASNGSTLPAAPSAPAAPPNRPKRPIASELTQQLKNFLDTLKSKKEFKIFLTPAIDQIVDETSKNSYLQAIKTPIDLSTIAKQIHKYNSIEQFESDILLMLNNCRNFNGPGVLTDIADECWKIWEQIKDSQVKSKRPRTTLKSQDPPPSTQPLPVKSTAVVAAPVAAPAPVAAVKPDQVESKDLKKPILEEKSTVSLLEKLKNAWNFVTSLDENSLFVAPVVEQYPDIAQEYRKVISKPIDLRTIKEKLPMYKTFKEFDEDICLMYRNAENFNKYDKFLLPIVRGMSNRWKKERSTFSQGNIVQTKELGDDPVELTPIPDDQRSEVNSMITDIRKSIGDALDYFSKIDKAGVFASPVVLPGYTTIIKDPRDLHSIRANILKYRTIDQFEADILLMFQNCVTFNHHTGDKYYVNLAMKLWNMWKENRKAVLLGEPLSNATIIHEIDHIDDKDLMELADNSEDEDWLKDSDEPEDKPLKQKRPRTDIPVSSNTKQPMVMKSMNKPAVEKAKPTKVKKDTFVKPLPLHIQTLGPLKSTINKPTPAPSIESLIASVSTSHAEKSQISVSPATKTTTTTTTAANDTFSIEVVSWAAIILHDSQLQHLFQQHLITLLILLCERGTIPYDDENLHNILFLTQYQFYSDAAYHEINQFLLRKILPLIMLLSLDSTNEHLPSTLTPPPPPTTTTATTTPSMEFNENLLQQYLTTTSSSSTSNQSLQIPILYEYMANILNLLKGKFQQTLQSSNKSSENILGTLHVS